MKVWGSTEEKRKLEEYTSNDPKPKEWQQMEDVVQLKLDPIQHFLENSCSPEYQFNVSFFLT